MSGVANCPEEEGAIAAWAVADARNIAPAATSVAKEPPITLSLRDNMIFLPRFARKPLMIRMNHNGRRSA
jgi:hypothetical protein